MARSHLIVDEILKKQVQRAFFDFAKMQMSFVAIALKTIKPKQLTLFVQIHSVSKHLSAPPPPHGCFLFMTETLWLAAVSVVTTLHQKLSDILY
jgi:hypothetical protein